MEVGAISGNTLSNVLRGQEGTVAASHSAGDIVENRFTAGAHNELATQAEVDAHKADYTLQVPYAVASGSANAYSVTLSPAPTSLAAGLALAVKINVDNTGASTINVNGLGAKAIKKPNGSDVSAGNLKADSVYTLRYNGVNFILQGSDAAGNATPADVLSGKTFSNDSGDQVGTMPNRGAVIITPGTSNQTIQAGYHNGSGYVVGDSNLVANNIKNGVAIFGVTGSLLPDVGGQTLLDPGAYGQVTWTSFTIDSPTFYSFSNATYYYKASVKKNGNGNAELVVVTNSAVDLTPYSKCLVFWHGDENGSFSGTAYRYWDIVISTTKTDGRDTYTIRKTYTDESADTSHTYITGSRFYDFRYIHYDVLDISSLSGQYYIRFHLRAENVSGFDSNEYQYLFAGLVYVQLR